MSAVFQKGMPGTKEPDRMKRQALQRYREARFLQFLPQLPCEVLPVRQYRSKHSFNALLHSQAWPSGSASGDGRNDGEGIIRGNGRLLLGRQIAHIFVVEIQIHKGTHLTFAGEQMLAQVGVGLRQLIERASNSSGRYFYSVVARREGTQRRGYVDSHSLQLPSYIFADILA